MGLCSFITDSKPIPSAPNPAVALMGRRSPESSATQGGRDTVWVLCSWSSKRWSHMCYQVSFIILPGVDYSKWDKLGGGRRPLAYFPK